MISQVRLKIEVKLLLSANRKPYVPRRLAQQRMTLSDHEWLVYASRGISAVAEILVQLDTSSRCRPHAGVEDLGYFLLKRRVPVAV